MNEPQCRASTEPLVFQWTPQRSCGCHPERNGTPPSPRGGPTVQQRANLNDRTKLIHQRPEEKVTLNGEIQDLKDMLEVKERKVNDLQNGMENLQEQLRDKEKQMGSLK